jgi:hypothetical protein
VKTRSTVLAVNVCCRDSMFEGNLRLSGDTLNTIPTRKLDRRVFIIAHPANPCSAPSILDEKGELVSVRHRDDINEITLKRLE